VVSTPSAAPLVRSKNSIATDFTSAEVWTKGGLVTYYLLVVMEIATRRVHFAGCTPNPHEPWMKQIVRNLTDTVDGFMISMRYVLIDRDGKFCPTFHAMLKDAGVNPVLLPPRSPNLNAHLERFHRSLKDEALNRMIFFGENSLQKATAEFLNHYHNERSHQGLSNKIIEPGEEVGRRSGEIATRERLGGLLRYYYRRAA
jgi:transposase InsO family protein